MKISVEDNLTFDELVEAWARERYPKNWLSYHDTYLQRLWSAFILGQFKGEDGKEQGSIKFARFGKNDNSIELSREAMWRGLGDANKCKFPQRLQDVQVDENPPWDVWANVPVRHYTTSFREAYIETGMLSKADCRRWWENHGDGRLPKILAVSEPPDLYSTRRPGRGTLKVPILAEHQRRIAADKAQHEVKAEAAELEKWAKDELPSKTKIDIPSAGAIENIIRPSHHIWLDDIGHPR